MRLHHVLDGPADGPPLLLASSLGTTHAMWEPQVSALSKHFRLVRCDRRGHGHSPAAAGRQTLDDLGRDLVWLGVNAPGRVDRLVLCCTAPAFPPREGWIDRAAIVRAEGLGAIADAVLGRWFSAPFHDTHPGVVSGFREMLVSTPREGYAGCCEVLADADLTVRLGEIAAPTLVLTGSEDPTVPPATGDALAASILGAEHVVLEGAAHLANVERPEAFAAALLRHLQPDGEDA